jgi:hypothetical protein
MPAGGYQPPANPAPASGPGALSQRTDGGPGQPMRALPNARYGENKEFMGLQRAADMAGQPTGAPGASPAGPSPDESVDLSSLVGLDAPTTRPTEPVTAGAPIGPGPGPSPEMPRPQRFTLTDMLANYLAHDMTGELADLYQIAQERGL